MPFTKITIPSTAATQIREIDNIRFIRPVCREGGNVHASAPPDHVHNCEERTPAHRQLRSCFVDRPAIPIASEDDRTRLSDSRTRYGNDEDHVCARSLALSCSSRSRIVSRDG